MYYFFFAMYIKNMNNSSVGFSFYNTCMCIMHEFIFLLYSLLKYKTRKQIQTDQSRSNTNLLSTINELFGKL